MLDFPWAWDWATFWPELVAGLITFAVGIPLALFLFWLQQNAGRQKDFKEFQTLAREIRDDFTELKSMLEGWPELVVARRPIVPIDPKPLTWQMDGGLVKAMFASRGVQLKTQQAVDWCVSTVDSARGWNLDLEAGTIDDRVTRKLTLQVQGSIAKLGAAIEELESTAKLGN